MQLERSEDNRSRSVCRSYSYVGRNSTKDEYIKFHGILKGKKQPDYT